LPPAFRANELDPQIARHAFDEAQAAFANARVALGSFAVCCGWVIVSTRFLPRWLGWLAIASRVALIFSRISWTSSIFLLPYGLAVGTGRGWTASPPRRRRWSTTTGRLSRTAPGQADAEPIATCGSSALSEGLWSQLGFRNAVRGHVLPGRTAALGEQPIGLFLSARLQPRHECDSIQSRQQPEAQTVDNFCI